MGNNCIVVEDGVIQCEHGAKVVLKSSVANHVIGGKKPLYDSDLIGAEVQGCTNNISSGGQCTKVASISSAVTETNVANKGKNYLLRVDGCQTDKGAALLLVDPGQTNTIIPTKSGANAGSIAIKELETAKLDTKENIKKEKYRIYPLRKSNGHVRALRGARNFQFLKNFHFSNNYTYDKIITKTVAYLYVTHNKKTTEYKVVNRGDMLNPQIYKVQFKDTATDVIRRYIPFYEESGTLEFVYSNIQLSKTQVANFPSTSIKVEDKKNACVIHPKVYSKAVKEDIKAFKKKELTSGVVTAESKTRAYVSSLLYINDPIGEVEDLYNEYEFSYHQHYGMNKALIDDIRAKNQYVYATTSLLEYLYIDDAQDKRHKTNKQHLQDLYEKLIDLVLTQMNGAIEENMPGKNIVPAIDFKIANDYYNELTFLFKEFFEGHYGFTLQLSDGHYTLTDNKRMQGGKLLASSQKYPQLKQHPQKALAFLVFSVSFSPRYKSQRTAELNSVAEEFYYLVKTSKPMPQLKETVLDDVKKELDYQGAYREFFRNSSSAFITEFELLDTQHKHIAFDPKHYAKKQAPFRLKKLQVGENPKSVYYDKHLQTPLSIAKKIAKALASKELQSLLQKLIAIKSFENEDAEIEYFNDLLNISYMLIAPRADLDDESELLSMFNAKLNKSITPFIQELIIKRSKLSQESAISVYNKPIQPYFINALYKLITQAKAEEKTSKSRKSNAQAFLHQFNQALPAPKAQTDKLLDDNFAKDLKVKTQTEELFATLKQIDGITSYIDKFDGTVSDAKKHRRGDIDITKLSKKLFELQSSKLYKASLASAKTLSFFLAVANISDMARGKEKLTAKNIAGVASDIISTTGQLHEWFPGVKAIQEAKNNLSRSVEFALQLDHILESSTVKVLSRFGLVGAMLNAYDEVSKIDAETNEEYRVAVEVKNVLYIALLFTPAFVALGAVALTELVWYLLSDSIENSNIELYLYDSLLFNKDNHNASRVFNHIDAPKAFMAKILLETLHNSDVFMDVKGFSTAKELQMFIAKAQESHPSLITAAMKNENARLLSVLYGVGLSVEEDKQVQIDNPYHNNSLYHAYPYVKLSKRLAKEMTHLLQLHNGAVLQDIQALEKEDGDTYYSTLFKVNLDTMQALGNMDATELIVATKNIALKYKVVYAYETSSMGYGNTMTLENLKIKELQLLPMSADDYKLLQ